MLSLEKSKQPFRPFITHTFHTHAHTHTTQVTLVGKVVSVTEHAACTEITLSDGTGTAPVKHWHDASEDGGGAGGGRATSALAPGTYIRVHGSMRLFDGVRSLVAYAIRPILDGNELTYHLLQAVFQHAHLKATGGVGGPVAAAAPGAAPAAAGVFGAGPKGAAAVVDDGGVGADGLTGLQRAAKAAVGELGASGANGASVDAVCGALAPAGHAAAAVRDAVTFLLEEGHLYSTIDENHVKVA
jgi:replication factor A2